MRNKVLTRILLIGLVAVTIMLLIKVFQGDWEPGVVASLDGIDPEELKVASFAVEHGPAEVEISAVGSLQSDTLLAAYPWILRRSDRSLIWRMTVDDSERGSGMLATVEDRIELDPDKYEVYFASYGYPDLPTASPEGFIDRLIHKFNEDFEKWRTESNRWEVVVKAGSEEAQSRLKSVETPESLPEDPLTIWSSRKANEKGISEFLFETLRPIGITVRCKGSTRNGSDSGGWIEDVETGEHIWDMDRAASVHAGGDRHNRMCEKDLRLDRGLYRAVYKSDYGEEANGRKWYGNPPYDPLSWGLTIEAQNHDDFQAVSGFDPFETFPKIVALTGIGDDALVSYSFRIDEPMRVLIYAVGEGYTGSNEMFDYAWLVDDKRRKEIWRMKASATGHAGGASKNRRTEVVLSLDPGSYTVHYKSDGSHSYEDWNSPPPTSPEHWGVTVFSLNPNFVPSIEPVPPVTSPLPPSGIAHDGEPLVAMTGMGDYESESSRFTLDEQSQLHIFALGEMTLDGRYDYGWITDARSGRTVWEMTRKNSERAGGSSKNRKVDTVITLPAGEYEAHYRSDDSHSYPGFKYGGSPDQPEAWGITIWKVPKPAAPTPPTPPTPPTEPTPPTPPTPPPGG